MRFFKDFEKVRYKFGNEASNILFQNITTYTDIIDQIKDDASFYQYEQIHEGFRPDQVSIRLYNSPLYHWTFYLMNDNLRLQGWPLTNRELEAKIKKDYEGTAITTRDSLNGIFTLGRTLTGAQSGSSSNIIHRNVEFGQIVVQANDLEFEVGESLVVNYPNPIDPQSIVTETVTVHSYSEYYNAAHHYIDGSGNWTDIDPLIGPGVQLTEVTNFENYINENEALRSIKVIRPNVINDILSAYKKSIRS